MSRLHGACRVMPNRRRLLEGVTRSETKTITAMMMIKPSLSPLGSPFLILGQGKSLARTPQYRYCQRHHYLTMRARSIKTELSQQKIVRLRARGRCLLSTTTSSSSSPSPLQDETPPIDPRRLVSIADNPKLLLEQIPLEDVRNVAFIAHIDHGKSSLSSRVLELTGNLGKDAQKVAWMAAMSSSSNEWKEDEEGSYNKDTTSSNNNNNNVKKGSEASSAKEQIELLDTLSVERQRGITVKASTASMLYYYPEIAKGPSGYLLINLYDTPGHADFGREVSRTLHFVEGAILLLDATQGIQAQTWSVHDKVKTLTDPPILLLALTKVDLPLARPIHVSLMVSEWLDWEDPDAILYTSARNRIGIKNVLDAICEQVAPPQPLADDDGTMLRAQVVDSWYEEMGVNCLVQIVSGTLKEGDRISIVASATDKEMSSQAQLGGRSFSVQEAGLVLPHNHRTKILQRGQMGYVRFGLKDPRQAMPGTILVFNKHLNKPMILPEIPDELRNGSKSVLYASVHPEEADGFDDLFNAVERLALNDIGLDVQKTSSLGSESTSGGPFLGPGLRVGFQGLLHVEVFRQRLLDEFGIEAVVTPPKVPYTISYLPSKRNNIKESYTKVVEDLSEWPEFGEKYRVLEPVVDVRIVARADDVGPVIDLLTRKRGTNLESQPIDEDKWLFKALMPWADIVTDFHDQLKNVTAGYGSLDTREADPPLVEADLHKVEIMLNGEVVEPLSFVCHRSETQKEGASVCRKVGLGIFFGFDFIVKMKRLLF